MTEVIFLLSTSVSSSRCNPHLNRSEGLCGHICPTSKYLWQILIKAGMDLRTWKDQVASAMEQMKSKRALICRIICEEYCTSLVIPYCSFNGHSQNALALLISGITGLSNNLWCLSPDLYLKHLKCLRWVEFGICFPLLLLLLFFVCLFFLTFCLLLVCWLFFF